MRHKKMKELILIATIVIVLWLLLLRKETFPQQPSAPHMRQKKPAFPIIAGTGYATHPNLQSYMVKYLNSSGSISHDCIVEKMAKLIPKENILPSTMDVNGKFLRICPSNESLAFRMWPF